jgi:hypothetical protein
MSLTIYRRSIRKCVLKKQEISTRQTIKERKSRIYKTWARKWSGIKPEAVKVMDERTG